MKAKRPKYLQYIVHFGLNGVHICDILLNPHELKKSTKHEYFTTYCHPQVFCIY